VILLKNVCFKYRETAVIKNCTVRFEIGEMHLIVGPTGAGKTTLALLASNLLKPDSGRIVISRGKLNETCKKIGFLFQDPEDLFFNDTVYDEIAYGAKKHRLKHVDELVSNTVEMVGLNEEILPQQPFNLSEGEKRLVALASILIWDPLWLILDEPFSGLDWQTRKKIVEIILKLKDGIGIILIANHMDDIIEHINLVTLIVNGEIVFTNYTKDIDWDIVYNAGCDIPYATSLSKKLREESIKVPIEYTVPRLIKALKNR
jgi:energy-coupling factor transporter ATP-binding protein EcfA2